MSLNFETATKSPTNKRGSLLHSKQNTDFAIISRCTLETVVGNCFHLPPHADGAMPSIVRVNTALAYFRRQKQLHVANKIQRSPANDH